MGTDTKAAEKVAGLRDCVSVGQGVMTAIAETAGGITVAVLPEGLHVAGSAPAMLIVTAVMRGGDCHPVP